MSKTGFSPFSAPHPPFSVTLDMDTLVRQIIADLTEKPETIRTAVQTNTKTNIKPDDPNNIQYEIKNNTEESFVNEIYLDNRVISLADLKERTGGATKLFISPKSILTPSAKDEIRKRKIEVAVKLPFPTSQSNPFLWLAFHQPAIFPYNLLNQLQKEFLLKQKSFAVLSELLKETERQLFHNKTHGVAVTKQSATAIRLANRCNTIRAIGCINAKQTAEDAAELNANLLVIHPERLNDTEIFEIISNLNRK
ncbi:MAG: hypothetical protein LBC20_00435 [Planctomycetaceae bacterium]|jgi:hypothetical protein|nr:hypothetical protein [Planctomycetaceae bacterium]